MDSDTKLKELSLYIAEKCKDDPSFGAVKLNKILFRADFRCYGLTGQAITGTDYVHRKNGPAPDKMMWAIDNLLEEGRGKLEFRPYYNRQQKRLVSLTSTKATQRMFTKDELSFVHEAIAHFLLMDATAASLETHNLIPWRLTKEGEHIPYFTVFSLATRPPLETEAIEWAKAEIAALGR